MSLTNWLPTMFSGVLTAAVAIMTYRSNKLIEAYKAELNMQIERYRVKADRDRMVAERRWQARDSLLAIEPWTQTGGIAAAGKLATPEVVRDSGAEIATACDRIRDWWRRYRLFMSDGGAQDFTPLLEDATMVIEALTAKHLAGKLDQESVVAAEKSVLAAWCAALLNMDGLVGPID